MYNERSVARNGLKDCLNLCFWGYLGSWKERPQIQTGGGDGQFIKIKIFKWVIKILRGKDRLKVVKSVRVLLLRPYEF